MGFGRLQIGLSQCLLAYALIAIIFPPAALAQDNESLQASRAVEALGMDLYRSFAPNGGNIVFSPYSISETLGLLSEGADGKTRKELVQALHWNQPPESLAGAFKAQDRQLDLSGQGEITLLVANGLWYQGGGEPRHAFIQSAQEAYGAEVRNADFIGNASAVEREINSWVELKTRGKITDLLPAGALGAATRLALVNAVYFKGKWEHPFEANRTASRQFFLLPGSSVMVPQMNETAELKVVSIPGADILELPYQGGALSMVLLLPGATDGLPSLEQSMTRNPASLLEWLASLDFSNRESVRVSLPRFKMTYEVDLTGALRQVGVSAAFDPHGADFSAIDGMRDLHVSTVLHKAFIDVSEMGTEAAAATFGGMATLGIRRSHEFNADHPFLFLIRDNTSGSVLFLGRVVDPRGQ
jgi:serpin B